MPTIIVKITWDVPNDPNWLNPYNIELVLAEYCQNTAFEVTKWPPGFHDVEQFYIEDDPEKAVPSSYANRTRHKRPTDGQNGEE